MSSIPPAEGPICTSPGLVSLACEEGGELGRGLGNFSRTPGTREQSLLLLPCPFPGLLRVEL